MESSLDITTRILYISSVSATDKRRASTSDSARTRAATRDTLPALILLLVTQGSLIVINPDGTASAWNVVWSLLPLIPALWLAWGQVRILRRADEYERSVQLEAMATGFGAAILLAMAGGVLDAAGIGSTRQSLQLVFIGGVLAWTITLAVKTSRSR
jgi:hypothetical protein